MAAGFSAPSHSRRVHAKVYSWFFRNQSKLFTLDIVWILLLFFLHLFTTTVHIFTEEIADIVQIIAVVPIALIILSIVWKGIVPLITCVLGIVLMHNSVILPYFSAPQTEEIISTTGRVVLTQYSTQLLWVATNMHFLLGSTMVALSIIMAYRPSILFTRNRPESLESEWFEYPIWHDHLLFADGKHKGSIPVKSLMTDRDKYLLWRYEFVLVNIGGTSYLVRPEGRVPTGSRVFRDKDSGMLIGKSRYSGFFM